MSVWVIVAMMAGEMLAAAFLYNEGKSGLALAFAGWAVSNVGLIMDIYR
jgi:hypothetical protein